MNARFTWTSSHSLTTAVSLAVLLTMGCARSRVVQTDEVLVAEGDARKAALKADAMITGRAMIERVLRSEGDDRTIDVLIISGGGDFGAFGAAFLRGWSEIEGDGAMPLFDGVTGVSTGALIAPFAFLGTKADLLECENLYRNPKSDWVRTRGPLFFMPDNESFAEVPGLERELRSSVSQERIERIAAQGEQGRALFVNTTDLDQGCVHPFELTTAAKLACTTGDYERVYKILLASAGIPGAFPPREIDGTLYADGGITSNILYGGLVKREQTAMYRFNQLMPDEPKLKMRYWVLLNNQARTLPHTTQPTWPDVIARSIDISIRASTLTSLRHLYSFAEVLSLQGDGEIEVRWIGIPNEWRAPVEGIFEKETMNNLADLGYTMGKDPSVWNSEAP